MSYGVYNSVEYEREGSVDGCFGYEFGDQVGSQRVVFFGLFLLNDSFFFWKYIYGFCKSRYSCVDCSYLKEVYVILN